MTESSRETRVLDAVVSLVDTLLEDFDVAELIAEVHAEKEKGTNPADPRVQALARRWMDLVKGFTGGDPAYRVDDVDAPHLLQDVTGRSGHDRIDLTAVLIACAALGEARVDALADHPFDQHLAGVAAFILRSRVREQLARDRRGAQDWLPVLQLNADEIAVIEEAMANFHRYFFIMPTLVRFELAVHQAVERGALDGALDFVAALQLLERHDCDVLTTGGANGVGGGRTRTERLSGWATAVGVCGGHRGASVRTCEHGEERTGSQRDFGHQASAVYGRPLRSAGSLSVQDE